VETIGIAQEPSDCRTRLVLQDVHLPVVVLYVLQVGETGTQEEPKLKNLSIQVMHFPLRSALEQFAGRALHIF
jgi:hypothetical protein